MSVAIIGAGMAGAACAQRLRTAGIPVTVFDKSRGTGGRLATRRTEHTTFDHGAPCIHAKSPVFLEQCKAWKDAGQLIQWDGAFVGTPGMNAPVKEMLGDSPLVTSAEITRIERSPAGWTLLTDTGPAASDVYEALVLALPAPQVVRLLRASGLPEGPVGEADYAPCWTALAEVPLPADWPILLTPSTGPLSKVIADGAKPGRSAEPHRLVLHATPSWSRETLEQTKDAAAEALFSALSDLRPDVPAPTSLTGHRWRFARVEVPAGIDCYWDSDLRFGACGDWARGGDTEGAWLSGRAAADRVLTIR